MKLASFDIFDTTLLRICGNPENVFYILSKRLFGSDEDKRKVFLEWRLAAESKATSNRGKATSINDIYDITGLEGLTNLSVLELVKSEIQVERDMLKPYPKVADIIKQYRDEGYSIAFISDMYLPSTFLKEILGKYGLFLDGDYLFVSNECNARKSDGSLYCKVKKELTPCKWIHYGDNRNSDIKNAKKQGINSVHVNTSFSDTENELINTTKSALCKYESSILSGITRYSRLTSLNPMDVFASLFVAPMYIPYIDYIKKKIDEHNFKKVYFLSRDAYILMKGFEVINNEKTESHYFFVSRKSLFLPFYYISTLDSILGAFSGQTLLRKRIEEICKLLKIEIEDLAIYSRFGKIDKVETKEQEKYILDRIYKSPLAIKIKTKAKSEYELFVKYLNQEGLLDSKSSVFVDVGWVGTSRLMINKILESVNAPKVHFIYYSTNKEVFPFVYGSYSSFRPHDGILTAYLEQYFSECPYHSTTGYTSDNGKIVPLFENNDTYEETEVFKSNLKIITNVLSYLDLCNIGDKEALGYWANVSRDSLVNCKENINYGILSRKEIDKHDIIMARKMTFSEAVKYLLGRNTGIFYELPSAVITFGYRFAHLYSPINKMLHSFVVKLK